MILANIYYLSVACPPGYYASNSVCLKCGNGTYNDEYYSTSCKPCPSETNSQTIGARSSKDCYSKSDSVKDFR